MNKIELALIELSRARKEVESLTKKIGEMIYSSGAAQMTNGRFLNGQTNWLQMAYLLSAHPENNTYDPMYEHHDGDIEAYLAANCEYSLNAHRLIQIRKIARKRLGIATRRVTVIANNLAKDAV